MHGTSMHGTRKELVAYKFFSLHRKEDKQCVTLKLYRHNLVRNRAFLMEKLKMRNFIVCV